MKVLVFGATGSAGGSVLRASLAAADVTEVCAIARRPLGIEHARLRGFVHKDFLDYTTVTDAFVGTTACFFCLGISATQVANEQEYRTITHDYALAAAHALLRYSPGAVFHFLSGQGAGAGSRFMWARVKGETENDLIDVANAVCWRPAFIDGEASANAPWLYQAMRPAARVFLRPFRDVYVAGEDIGRAMLAATRAGLRARVIGNREIRELAGN